MSRVRAVFSGEVAIDVPADEAWRLFTAEGERRWVAGWEPAYPVPPADDSDPGTVFVTTSHGRETVWRVLDRVPGRLMRYANVTAGISTATVTVRLADVESGGSTAAVDYDMVSLSEEGDGVVASLAGRSEEFLLGWQEAIAGRP